MTDKAYPHTFAEFVAAMEEILGSKAQEKGYTSQDIDGPNDVADFVQRNFGDAHFLTEALYKLLRFRKRGDSHDLVKAAAWCFLLWRTKGSTIGELIEKIEREIEEVDEMEEIDEDSGRALNG